MDITQNIRAIEVLKSNLLAEVAFLFEIMAYAKAEPDQKEEILSEIIALSYMLGEKLGTDLAKLEELVNAKLE